jgi:hypothetical protein
VVDPGLAVDRGYWDALGPPQNPNPPRSFPDAGNVGPNAPPGGAGVLALDGDGVRAIPSTKEAIPFDLCICASEVLGGDRPLYPDAAVGEVTEAMLTLG